MRDIVGDAMVDDHFTPVMAAEDFAHMLKVKPGCYAFIGNGSLTLIPGVLSIPWLSVIALLVILVGLVAYIYFVDSKRVIPDPNAKAKAFSEATTADSTAATTTPWNWIQTPDRNPGLALVGWAAPLSPSRS